MKNTYFLFAFVLLSIFSCKNECQDQLDSIQSAKNTYTSNPTEANCVNYKNLMQSYINSSCKSQSEGVNYETLFSEEINNLSCQ